MKAGALDAVEYKVAFEIQGQGVGEPIAGHVRGVLAICHALGTPRASLKPVLDTLDALRRKEDDIFRHLLPVECVNTCKFCHAKNALIVREYVSVCQECGYENESCHIQDHMTTLRTTNTHCGSHKDTRRLDAVYKDVGACMDTVEGHLRRMRADGFLNVAQEERAVHLATLYILDHKIQTRRKCPLMAASCAIYALLETWATMLVPVQIIAKEAWITKWVLPTNVFHSKKRKHVA